MSDFISSVATGLPLLGPGDMRHADSWFFGGPDLTPGDGVLANPVWTCDPMRDGFQSPWWPSQGLFGDSGDVTPICSPCVYTCVWVLAGQNGRLAFVGVTRDAYGSPIGGATVRCFRAATDELTAIVTSDPAGNYIATTPYYEAHYLVVHKSGSPDVAGASVATLFPS